ncbi:MAG: DUF302 domain-containing protein [Fibrobacterota bacterium]
MSTTDYGYGKKVSVPFDEAKDNITEELKKEGFGILTEIDVQATLKKKLDVDFNRYAILGACNPPNALKALQAEIEIGLMLPCNVIVYEKEGSVFVSAVQPAVAMGMIDNDELKEIAESIGKKLRKSIDSLS